MLVHSPHGPFGPGHGHLLIVGCRGIILNWYPVIEGSCGLFHSNDTYRWPYTLGVKFSGAAGGPDGVGVAVGSGVAVCVGVGVFVGSSVGVCVGVLVGSGVAVAVGVGMGSNVAVGVFLSCCFSGLRNTL